MFVCDIDLHILFAIGSVSSTIAEQVIVDFFYEHLQNYNLHLKINRYM